MNTTTVADAVRARKCWRTLEPYHGFIYFSPAAEAEYERIGVTGRSGYFLSRAAALGRVTTPTIQATFYNFHPELVATAVDSAGDWDPAAVLDARLRAADNVLRDRLGNDVTGPGMEEAVALIRPAVEAALDHVHGRPLAAAHLALPIPDEPHLALWWSITGLREFRGDGHLTALVDAELTGLEALVVHAATGEVTAEALRTTRSWSAEEWNAAAERLRARGVLDADGALTEQGREHRAAVEARTDRLAALAWRALDDDAGARLRALVRPWSKAVFA